MAEMLADKLNAECGDNDYYWYTVRELELIE